MGSLMSELAAREEAARARVAELKTQMTALAGQLAEQEEILSRLAITKATINEVLAGTPASWATGQETDEADDEDAPIRAAMAGPYLMVPPWSAEADEQILPVAYRDVVEVLTDGGGPLRAKEISRALGLGDEPRHVEGMRSKLKRLVERGWLCELAPGQFTRAQADTTGENTGR